MFIDKEEKNEQVYGWYQFKPLTLKIQENCLNKDFLYLFLNIMVNSDGRSIFVNIYRGLTVSWVLCEWADLHYFI